MRTVVQLLLIVSIFGIAGCSPDQPKRHPMVQRDIDQCIAGLGGLLPDDDQRKIVCECTADATVKYRLDTDAMFKAVTQCRDKAGLDPNDPFDILDDGRNAAQSAAPTEYKDEAGDYDDAGYAAEEASPDS